MVSHSAREMDGQRERGREAGGRGFEASRMRKVGGARRDGREGDREGMY